jgi:hypothetical protein
VTTASLPRLRGPLARRLASGAGQVARRLLNPAKPALGNLASIPLTVAGWALISACAFQVSTTLGLGASGIVLMVLEHQIADEAD